MRGNLLPQKLGRCLYRWPYSDSGATSLSQLQVLHFTNHTCHPPRPRNAIKGTGFMEWRCLFVPPVDATYCSGGRCTVAKNRLTMEEYRQNRGDGIHVQGVHLKENARSDSTILKTPLILKDVPVIYSPILQCQALAPPRSHPLIIWLGQAI